jgi:hypothetical protein
MTAAAVARVSNGKLPLLQYHTWILSALEGEEPQPQAQAVKIL